MCFWLLAPLPPIKKDEITYIKKKFKYILYILYEHQYGFQRQKSTEHSIVHALNFINRAMNENKYSVGVFFDLKKAFDVCSHDILLMKLSRMGNGYLWYCPELVQKLLSK